MLAALVAGMLFFVGASFAAPPINIDDTLQNGQTVRGILQVVGFAQLPNSEGYVQVDVVNSNSEIAFSEKAVYPTPRSDVPNSGFILNIDTDAIPNGDYTVWTTSFNSQGTRVASESRRIRVQRLDHRGDFEQPARASVVSGQAVDVAGWALAEGGFKDLTLSVSGVPATGVSYGVAARPDVANAFPSYGLVNTAFHTRLDLTGLAHGPNRLTLSGTSATGIYRDVVSMNIIVDRGLDVKAALETPAIDGQVDGTSVVPVTGWFSSHTPMVSATLYLNDRPVATTTDLPDRPDVRTAQGRAYGQGFSFQLPPLLLTVGMHRLTVEGTDSAGNRINVSGFDGRVPRFTVGSTTRVLGAHLRPANDYSATIAQYASSVGANPQIVMYFQGFTDSVGRATQWNGWPNLPTQVRTSGGIPMITWESHCHGTGFSLDEINSGKFDSYIESYARQIQSFGTRALLRLDHEFNSKECSWTGYKNNNDPSKYVQMWRRIVTIFRNVGAHNARFIWAPNYAAPQEVLAPSNDFQNYYPGDAYVDFIGVSGYNWGNDPLRGGGWQSPASVYDNFMNSVARNYPTKPVIVSEIGTLPSYGNNSAPDWIKAAFARFEGYQTLKGVVWFNDYAFANETEADFRVGSTPHGPPFNTTSGAAYKASALAWAAGITRK